MCCGSPLPSVPVYAPRPLASAALRSCVLRPRPLASVPVCCGPGRWPPFLCAAAQAAGLRSYVLRLSAALRPCVLRPSAPVYAPRPLALSAAALPHGAGPSIAFVRPLSSGAGAATLCAVALRSAVLCAVAPLLRPSRMAQVPPLLSSGPYLLAQEQRPSLLRPSRMAQVPHCWRRSYGSLAQVSFYRGGLHRKCGFCAFQWRRSYRKNRTCTGELGDLHRRVGRPAPRGWGTCATLWKGTEPVAALPRDLRRTVGKLFSQGGGLSHSGYFSP